MVRHRPIQGESNIDFLGESEWSLPLPEDSFPDAGEAINDFWSMSWFQRYRMHLVGAEKASTCRSKGANGEWIGKVYDHVFACNSLEGNISQMEVVEDFESRPHKAVLFFWLKEKRRCRNGTSRSCRRCCLVTVEVGCQEEG